MKIREVNIESLTPGMLLYSWTKEARRAQGHFSMLQAGPDGSWHAMVVANCVCDSRTLEGFVDPPVHQIDVMFWNEEGHQRFESFFWTQGTYTQVIV